MFAIASLTVAVIGAISGQAVGSSPMLQSATSAVAGTSAPDYEGFADIAQGERPPDHYPLVTPEGTVPVAELALHGRLRNKASSWWGDGQTVLMGADYGAKYAYSDAEMEHLAHAEPVEAAMATEPQEGPRGSGESTSTHGSARVVDVAAALAAQDQI